MEFRWAVGNLVKNNEDLSSCNWEGVESEEFVQTWVIGVGSFKKGCFMQPQEIAKIINC